jgi:hypothetical protein
MVVKWDANIMRASVQPFDSLEIVVLEQQ